MDIEFDLPVEGVKADFAYTDENGTGHLPIGDAEHVTMAIEAVTVGFRGNKAKIPEDKRAGVIAKIAAAARQHFSGDELKEKLAKLHGHSNAVKALDEGVNRLGGYLVRWGDASQKDLTGEYFTKSTDLALDWYEKRPMLYQHGLNGTVKATVIGTIDKLEPDEVGLWAEGELNKHNAYTKKVQELVTKGVLGWSSGTLAHLKRRNPDGQIVRWPVVEGSLTPTPAEPRDTWVAAKTVWDSPDQIQLAYKALNLSTDALLQETDTEGGQETAGEGHAKALNDTEKPSTNEDVMDAETIKAIAEATALAVAAALPKAAEPPTAPLKSLPEPGRADALPVAAAAKSVEPKLEYMRDRRYADWSPEDMSCWRDTARYIVKAFPTSDEPAVNLARKAVHEWTNDQDHKYERELAVKGFQWAARKWTNESMLDTLPFKSVEDAYSYKLDEAALKALELDSTGQATFGQEWVPAIWANDILRRIRISNPVASNLMAVNMPTNPFYYPIESTDPTVYFVSEATDATQLVLGTGNTITLSKPATNKITLTAKKLGARVAFSTELNEDSIVAVMPQFRYQIVRALRNYLDDTILNGDVATAATTNINLIDGTPTAGTSYLAMDGFRKYVLVTNTAQGLDLGTQTPTVPLVRQVRFKLATQYAVDLSNLVAVCDVQTYAKLLNLPEFVSNENANMGSTSFTGKLPGAGGSVVEEAAVPVGMIDGMPVYVSAQLGLSQATGKISGTPANNKYGQFLVFHRTRWLIGYRRQVSFEQANFPFFSDTIQMQATVRFAITSFDATSAALGYDILV